MVSSNPNPVFTDFELHASLPRTSTTTTLAASLKSNHPDYHLTPVVSRTIGLLAYAAAGHATCSLCPETPPLFTIGYTPPPLRLSRKTNPGTLSDNPTFVKYTYSWSGTAFLLYKAVLPNIYGNPETFLFLLTPSTPADPLNPATTRTAATDRLLIAAGQWTQDLHSEILVFDANAWRKDATLWKSVQGASWDAVILAPATKSALIEDVEGFFDAQGLYNGFGVPWKRGVILHGRPGNGKTMSLRALMAALQERVEPVPSLYVKSLEGCNGPQYAIRAIFERARRMAPCLLVLEDLDSLVTDEVRSYFLNEVDGLEANEGVLMVGSTNHLGALDPAIRDRPSRFDRKYEFRLPGFDERVAYAKYWRGKVLEKGKAGEMGFEEGVCEVLARMTEGFSFAYLKEAFVAALLVIARGGTGEEKVEEKAEAEETVVEPSTAESGVVVEAETEGKEKQKEVGAISELEIATPQPQEETAEAKALYERAELARRRKEVLANVPVPLELQHSVLIRVMRQQIQMLLSEMDNNDGAKANLSMKQGKGKDSKKVNAAKLARFRNMAIPTSYMEAVPMN